MRKSDFNDERPGIFRTWKEARPMLWAALTWAIFWTLSIYQCTAKE